MKGILVVRKYKNRRLYDTERSTHITRDELLETIRTGRVVQVQEADTGEDVTVETLFQVVLSESGSQLSASIPSAFAHFLARAGKDEMEKFFREYMPVALQAFQASLRHVQEGQRRMMETFFPCAPGWGGGWPGFPSP